MISLSQKQKAIIDDRGYLLVTGGPGSGKTTAAIFKAQKESKDLEEYQHILFLSFSNSAVNQIRKASGINLSKDERRRVKIQTFHSFCFSMLKSYRGLCGIKPPISVFPPEEEACVKAKYGINTEIGKDEFLRGAAIKDGKICFDLFADLAFDILRKSKSLTLLLQSCYPVVIIDEFQDTDHCQWELIRLLGQGSRLVCLADPYQRIYDFRKGVTSERINHFKSYFSPTVIDLGQDNHRSQKSDILTVADCIVKGQAVPKGQNVTYLSYQYPNQVGFYLKMAIANLRRNLKEEKSVASPQICILARTNNGSAKLSAHLKKKTQRANYIIKHDLITDDNTLLYIQRFLCALLETNSDSPYLGLSALLSELIDLHYSLDTQTYTNYAANLSRWKQQVDQGIMPSRVKICTVLDELIKNIPGHFNGNFVDDINLVADNIKRYNNQYLNPIISFLDQGVSFFKNPKMIQLAGQIYAKHNKYTGLKQAFQGALFQSKVLGIHPINSSVVVMTMHKSKGKEYDGVIIYDGPHNDSITLRDDTKNFSQTRILVRVAMTRARHYVVFLYQQNNLPTILS